MSWFSKYIGDPLKALLAKVEATGEAELKQLAGQVAAQLPAAPVSATAESAFETALTTAADVFITAGVGSVPAVGTALAPTAVAVANEVIDYMVTKGTAQINALAAAAKASLAEVAAAGGSSTGVAEPGAVGAAG
jgi:hypothetical protein